MVELWPETYEIEAAVQERYNKDIMIKYKFNSKKRNRKQHICTADGVTYCKAENGSWRFDTLVDSPDPQRQICGICRHLHQEGRKPINCKTGNIEKSRTNWEKDFFLRSWEWKNIRWRVLQRDGHRCRSCGATAEGGARMNVDHIIPRYKNPELALTLSNLQVLCADCNHGKGNWDQTDWRPKNG